MKPRLSLNECDGLIQLLKSEDEENVNLACQILLSKSYKTTMQLRTAIYRARLILKNRDVPNPYGQFMIGDKGMCILALKRYKQKLIKYGN